MDTTSPNDQTTPEDTQQRIINAIERIQRRGEKITGTAVRAELGGGSFSTITPILKQWRESHRQLSSAVQEIPDSIRDRLLHLGGMIFRECEQEAKQEYRLLKQQYQDDTADLEAVNAEQAMEIAQLQNRLSAALNERQEAIDQHSQLKEHLHQQEIRQITLENELKSTKERVRQLATETGEQKQEIKDLNKQIAELNRINGQLEARIQSGTSDQN